MSILTRLKSWRPSWWDALTAAILISLLVMRGPGWIESWRLQGTQVTPVSLGTLDGGREEFPRAGQGASALVFWATWCGPCEVELGRLAKGARDGKYDPKRVVAVSVGESAETVRKAVAERGYPFRVLLDPYGQLAAQLKVSATPTVVLLSGENKAEWIGAGLSPTLGWRVEHHLGNPPGNM